MRERVVKFRSANVKVAALSPRSVCFAMLGSVVCSLPTASLAADAASGDRSARGSLPAPLVYLRDIDASIVQDMRYAGSDNFTGAPVPGYDAPECILTRKTADALAAVQRRLAKQKLSLKVYDCYRPVKAVAAFMRWVNAKARDEGTIRFYPELPRQRLVSLGYIAARSGHSRANVVDLTIVNVPLPETPPFEPQRIYGACTAGAETRAPDDSLDMGTGFDCFDPKSNVGAPSISESQERNRETLADAMAAAGFKAYAKEWWHFSFPPGDPGRAFDVDIAPRP
jgi:D-alanyl-D-alanine dipeptidase